MYFVWLLKHLPFLCCRVIVALPTPEQYTGPSIFLIRATSYDVHKYHFADIIRAGSLVGEMLMLEDIRASVCGLLVILDMSGANLSHLLSIPSPKLLNRFRAFSDKAMPFRPKGIYFINVPLALEIGFQSFRPFFPASVKNRVNWQFASLEFQAYFKKFKWNFR